MTHDLSKNAVVTNEHNFQCIWNPALQVKKPDTRLQHRTDREKQDLAYPYVVSECSISVKVNPTVAGKTEKPWQTSITFLEWVKTLNNEMKKKYNRKTAPLLDNATIHVMDLNL